MSETLLAFLPPLARGLLGNPDATSESHNFRTLISFQQLIKGGSANLVQRAELIDGQG